MGRGRVEMKRIENKINRQVTFSKRKASLFKKANELSVLCDAEIGLIIFSSRGKLFHFSSCNTGITKTLERYQRCCVTAQGSSTERELQSWNQEILNLKAKYESLQQTQRRLLGEDLGSLSLKELQNLEKQLEGTVQLARERKAEIMKEQIEDLRQKERYLGDLNEQLKTKLDAEGYPLKAMENFWSSDSAAGSSHFHVHPSETNSLQYQPGPSLQIGYNHYDQAEGSSAPKSVPSEDNFLSRWSTLTPFKF